MAETDDAPWWESGVVYQIYPRSFQDSDGDGIGDLNGIRSRLDYVESLGVDAIWLSPIFPSPMADFGYDVADYCDVDPLFGDLEQFDALLSDIHARGLKLLLDFVPNHTSDQHPWFIESRSSRDNPKRDWYIWRDAKPDGSEPNNWVSDFGGSAWEWDGLTGQYYLHAFLKEQPDVNWRQPELRAAMMDVLRFWLDRGVDGFRIDVIWHMVKHADFPDNPQNPDWTPQVRERDRLLQTHSTDQPEAHAFAADMRRLADSYDGRVLIGEVVLPIDRLVGWYGTPERPQVHLPFNFELIDTQWNAAALRTLITAYEAALPSGGWPNWVLGSHDDPRIAARLSDAQSRVAAMLLLTLRGTPTLYQGDELGIGDVVIPAEQIRDPQHHRQPELNIGRDGSRTPMPWDNTALAGFSSVEPWLPLNEDCQTRNVANQNRDAGSLLNLYRELLALRRQQAPLSIGAFSLNKADKDVLSFIRVHGGEVLLVVLNLGSQSRHIFVPDGYKTRDLMASTQPLRPVDATIAGDEGLIIRLEKI